MKHNMQRINVGGCLQRRREEKIMQFRVKVPAICPITLGKPAFQGDDWVIKIHETSLPLPLSTTRQMKIKKALAEIVWKDSFNLLDWTLTWQWLEALVFPQA